MVYIDYVMLSFCYVYGCHLKFMEHGPPEYKFQSEGAFPYRMVISDIWPVKPPYSSFFQTLAETYQFKT